MLKVKTYANGLKLVVKKMEGLLSVSAGVMVKTGAANETDEEDGISHFIEHMQFKGTREKTAFEISDAFDRMGAQVNAFTSKELTCYYAKCTSDHTEETCELLFDMFLKASYPQEETEREKGVVCEEIHMNEDTPDDLCFDVLYAAIYGNDGYGRNILGKEKNVRGFTKSDMENYKAKYYHPENMVVVFAGGVDFSLAEKVTDKYFSDLKRGNVTAPRRNTKFSARTLMRRKKIEQTHIAIAFPSLTRDDPLCDALQTFNGVFGGGMSSRLFQEVREKSGLAYSVYSYASLYEDCGNLIVYAGVNPEKSDLAMRDIGRCIADLKKNGITDEEFLRGREQMKASLLFSQESTSSQMLLYGKEMLLSGREYDFEGRLNSINKVTKKDAEEIVERTFDGGKYAVGVVGNIRKGAEFVL
ncbi:MAG: pitrilysin family protein [Candidatus Borkfalkiaceae bacterium]|nr:pitrilysin family protein [Clostridia bacterium]MDY6222869.1 pitrilysin family protein [Christensenellaceae bacterium]